MSDVKKLEFIKVILESEILENWEKLTIIKGALIHKDYILNLKQAINTLEKMK